MNPIEKVTDHTFTSSTKGLLTLFCIGLFHLVIGVKFTSNTIAIPWLPEVELSHIDRLIFLYWLLVVYACYRFVLYHLPVMRKHYFLSLGEYLKDTSGGTKFIQKHIYSDKLTHQVVVDIDGSPLPEIKIEHYQDGGAGWEQMASFNFVFTREHKFIKILASENPTFKIDEISFTKSPQLELWGLKTIIDDDGDPENLTSKIASLKLKVKLLLPVLMVYLKTLITTKEVFDLLVPLLLNFALFSYWLISCISI
ncbi:hypothetical protein BOO24_20975 [Vibrio navarrensis]|uniref:hypothetical protein n=1 Tax=Vibrio TaxID=662 RepID=UPI00164BDD4D|nr:MULTISPECIES: hypothetical protein [Vibrio]EJL6763031.1 hypothetical protein [Vibrio cholerae]MBC5833242.1 hypothetical protein [Vibrio metschnikovii]MBE4594800.1 hypothetical protein [Vibrio navarrensis]